MYSYVCPAFTGFGGQEIIGYVIRKYILEQLGVVGARFGDVGQLFGGLLLPEEVQTRRHFHQSGMVSHHVEEEEYQHQHRPLVHHVQSTASLRMEVLIQLLRYFLIKN